jgi:hypothetical protein
MTMTQPVEVAHYSRKADSYKCSCGDTFEGIALLKTHLDLLREETGTHIELAVSRAEVAVAGDRCKRQVALEIRPRTPRFRVCLCGFAFADLAALDDHLDEFGDGSGHEEMAFDLGTLVRFGIRRIRIERGLSMHTMADLLGVHTSAVCRIESGKRNAVGWGRTPRTVAVLLEVDVRELLRVCEYCGYRPPTGCRCMRCGVQSAV